MYAQISVHSLASAHVKNFSNQEAVVLEEEAAVRCSPLLLVQHIPRLDVPWVRFCSVLFSLAHLDTPEKRGHGANKEFAAVSSLYKSTK